MNATLSATLCRLPPLREELTLHAGPIGADGAPTWNLQDPVRNRFFRIDWPTFLILSHWHFAEPQAICAAIAEQAPVDLDTDDVDAVLKFMAQSELLQTFNAQGTERLFTVAQRMRQAPWKWLLHHYLFFRIPLLRPDTWLTRMLPRVSFFYSATFLRLTLLALAIGLFQTVRQWSHFTATFVDTLSWEGLTGYAVVLIAIKFLHELGHAFTAKRYGCRVPTMGVAFLVMWPVAYTDVNETWKLDHRYQRLAVSAAGVLVELAVAAWATLAWALLPDGSLRSWAFLLAAVTWISTLVINASPFMRFDGYFLLSDWLDLPNLHHRAFALARWRMRELLFALDEEKPEPFPKRRERFLIVFAWLTWLYRISLFLGIAVLVYRHFFKALGVFLFAVEIAWFVVVPIAAELREWSERRAAILAQPRTRRSAVIAALLLTLGCLPINFRVSAQGILKPVHAMQIYAPAAATVITPPQQHGATVAAGQTIVELDSVELRHREALAQARLGKIQAQLTAAAFDATLQRDLPVLREQLATANAELEGIQQEKQRFAPTANFAGMITDPLPALQAGDAVARNAPLATLIDPNSWEVKVYVDESDLLRLSAGDRARFYPEAAGVAAVELTVTEVNRDASRQLSELLLASTHGGQIPVHTANNVMIPDRAIYGVTLAATRPADAAMIQQLRGRVIVYGKAQTLFGEYFKTAAAVLIRESGW
jgi:putative peptide zinc metalloprotease protein